MRTSVCRPTPIADAKSSSDMLTAPRAARTLRTVSIPTQFGRFGPYHARPELNQLVLDHTLWYGPDRDESDRIDKEARRSPTPPQHDAVRGPHEAGPFPQGTGSARRP